MNWKVLLASISGLVDQELLLRNEYLMTENRILRQQLAQQAVEHMTQSYTLAAITPPISTQACALLQRHPLRADDALHLACALVAVTQK
jgi:predicted nucleic acid-binding protein